jgi:dephospho-CoA kinase
MRELVFADATQRVELEGILHPRIAQEVVQQADAATGLYVVFVVPLLIESGRWRERIDRLCVVDCEEETQVARVQTRSAIPAETIRRIMAAQVSRAERLAAADDIIANMASTSLQDLEKQVLVLHKAWCNLA